MLQHIALAINDREEIVNFYEKILLFGLKYKFSLNGEISRQIFNTRGNVDVFMMEHHDTRLEIFLGMKKEKKVFSHICLSYWKSEIVYKKAVENGYKTFVKKKSGNDTYFIWDKSGNMFEIKEIIEQND